MAAATFMQLSQQFLPMNVIPHQLREGSSRLFVFQWGGGGGMASEGGSWELSQQFLPMNVIPHQLREVGGGGGIFNALSAGSGWRFWLVDGSSVVCADTPRACELTSSSCIISALK